MNIERQIYHQQQQQKYHHHYHHNHQQAEKDAPIKNIKKEQPIKRKKEIQEKAKFSSENHIKHIKNKRTP